MSQNKSNMLQVSPMWTQKMHLIFNMKMNHDEVEWKSVLQWESADLLKVLTVIYF
jgi:hypothetical protein